MDSQYESWVFCVEKGILKMNCWVVVSNIFYFHPYLGKIPILTNIFQMGWNHQLDWDARLHMSYVLKQVFIMKLFCVTTFFGMFTKRYDEVMRQRWRWFRIVVSIRHIPLRIPVHVYIYILPWWYTVMIKTCAAQLKAVRIWICDPTQHWNYHPRKWIIFQPAFFKMVIDVSIRGWDYGYV